MKRRLLSVLVALCMVFTLAPAALPAAAFADVVSEDVTVGSGATFGTDGTTYTGTVTNNGTISAGTFTGAVTNMYVINGGTFSNTVTNREQGVINNGTFNGAVTNMNVINDGTFSNTVTNQEQGVINNGTFTGAVTNMYVINGGTFSNTVTNREQGVINRGTFNGPISGQGTIYGGTFTGDMSGFTGTIDGKAKVTVTVSYVQDGTEKTVKYTVLRGQSLAQSGYSLPSTDALSLPENLDPDEYSIDGWLYFTSDGAELFDKDTPVPSDITVQPNYAERLTFTAPFELEVKQLGSANPGRKTFELELLDESGQPLSDSEGPAITASVATNGAGTYPAELSFTGSQEQLEGQWYFVRLKNDAAPGWTYSEDVYSLFAADKTIRVYEAELTDDGSYTPIESTTSPTMHFTAAYNMNAYSVTYTDGVDGVEVFADQVKGNLLAGDKTPGFEGTPKRAGYVFSGWSPKVASTVSGNAVYTATWTEEESKSTKSGSQKKKSSNLLLAKVVAKGAHTQKLTWTKVPGADGYTIWFSRCSSGKVVRNYKKVKTVKASAKRAYARTKLVSGLKYKYYVTAWRKAKGKKTTIATSPAVHSIAGNVSGRFSNVKSVKSSVKKVSLKAGKRVKLRAPKFTVVRKGKAVFWEEHAAKVRYVSSDKSVATVTSTGKIKAKKAGKCKVYILACNGVRTSVTVTVK